MRIIKQLFYLIKLFKFYFNFVAMFVLLQVDTLIFIVSSCIRPCDTNNSTQSLMARKLAGLLP